MNGAENPLRTLVGSGGGLFRHMLFVAAVDRVEGMRLMLGLFEGLASHM